MGGEERVHILEGTREEHLFGRFHSYPVGEKTTKLPETDMIWDHTYILCLIGTMYTGVLRLSQWMAITNSCEIVIYYSVLPQKYSSCWRIRGERKLCVWGGEGGGGVFLSRSTCDVVTAKIHLLLCLDENICLPCPGGEERERGRAVLSVWQLRFSSRLSDDVGILRVVSHCCF